MNRYLIKLAKKQEAQKEKPHVEHALKKLDETGGVITHWSTGSGKTRGFLLAAEKALNEDKSGRALIVAPASLVTNVDKEIKKHGLKIDRKRLDVYSYEKAVRIADDLKKNRYSIAIADEAQKLRNAKTKRSQELSEVMSNADKRLLATATANFNHAADIAPLINIARGEKVLPEDRREFEKHFIGKAQKPRSIAQVILGHKPEEVEVLKNSRQLGDFFEDHVSYYDSKEDPEAVKKFPKVSEKTIEVPMSHDQAQHYKFVEGQIPFWLRMKIRNNLPLDKQEKAQLNSFSTGVRQASNSYRHLRKGGDAEFTPKIHTAVENLAKAHSEDKNFRGLVYSNYLDAGVREYSRKLTQKGIKHVVFTGELSKEEKDKAVQDYNSGKVKALLISSSGAEGLDLKGTKLIQVLEPHFNPSKIRQVVGRGARYESHEHLPEEERKVAVEHYLSTHPKPMFGKAPVSIDKYLSGMSDDKQQIFDQIKKVMKDRGTT